MATKRKRVYNVLVKYEGDGDLIVEMAVADKRLSNARGYEDHAGYNMAEVFRFILDSSVSTQWKKMNLSLLRRTCRIPWRYT